jgi:hypothetical protein
MALLERAATRTSTGAASSRRSSSAVNRLRGDNDEPALSVSRQSAPLQMGRAPTPAYWTSFEEPIAWALRTSGKAIRSLSKSGIGAI